MNALDALRTLRNSVQAMRIARNAIETFLRDNKNGISVQHFESLQRAATHLRGVLGANPNPIATTEIEKHYLSIRVVNILDSLDINTYQDLTELSADDLMAVRNFGLFCLKEIRNHLAERGLHLRGESP